MFGSISGKYGTIKIVELGAVIGQFSSWRLVREKKQGRDDEFTELFRFTGELEYVNPTLFHDEDYSPQVFITVQRDKKTRKETQFRLDQQEGAVRSLDGRGLLMEGVTLCRL